MDIKEARKEIKKGNTVYLNNLRVVQLGYKLILLSIYSPWLDSYKLIKHLVSGKEIFTVKS